MRKIAIVLLILMFASGAAGEMQDDRRAQNFNLDKDGFALQGYDPVSYHQAQPQTGKNEFSTTYMGIRYRFASQANLDAFLAQPAVYEPAYGGWCAWAMLEGDKVDVDPESFKLIDGRVYVFYDGFFGDTLKKWNARAQKEPEPSLVKMADDQWSKVSKE